MSNQTQTKPAQAKTTAKPAPKTTTTKPAAPKAATKTTPAAAPKAEVKAAPAAAKGPSQYFTLWDNETNTPVPFDVDTNIVFADAESGEVPVDADAKKADASAKPISYFRIPIKGRYEDGSVSDFLIMFDDVFSFGISKSTKPGTSIHNGYSFGFSLYQGEPSEKQQYIESVLQAIENKIKDHVLEVKDTVGQYDLESVKELKGMRLLRWKMDKGQRVAGFGPTINTKVMCNAKKDFEIMSKFYLLNKVDHEGNMVELNPYELIGKRGTASPLVKLNNVFIGSTVKAIIANLYDAEFDPQEAGIRRIRPVPRNAMVVDPDQVMKSMSRAPKAAAPATGTPPGDAPEAGGDGEAEAEAVAPPKKAPPKPVTATNGGGKRVVKVKAAVAAEEETE